MLPPMPGMRLRQIVLTGLFTAVFSVLSACGGAPKATHAVTASTAPATGGATAAAAPAKLRLRTIGHFNSPVYLAQAPGDPRRLFVVEQAGRVRIVRDGHVVARPFLDIVSRVKSGGEQGLLSIAFAPDYASSGRFYVDYTDTNGDSRIVEYRRSASSPERANVDSARLVLFQRQPEPNHNGGLLLFGPDRLLYIGFGDGGGGGDQHGPIGNAQSLHTLLGKILRIDPRQAGRRAYSIPASNPFVHRAGARGEIYAWGLRNPWRFSFDRANGDLAIGDVGQDRFEEIDFARRGRARGANYGWRAFEGTSRYDPSLSVPHAVGPVLTYSHSGGGCSITGGYIVRDPRLPQLAGRYVYGDFCAGKLLSARLLPGHAVDRRTLGLTVPSLSSFGQDAAGRVYALSLDGPVYRLDPR
jgi:glucose/arabinose dehydrogenase